MHRIKSYKKKAHNESLNTKLGVQEMQICQELFGVQN